MITGESEDHAAMSVRPETQDRIERQRELIDYLRTSGLATASADALLRLNEQIFASMLVHNGIIGGRAADV